MSDQADWLSRHVITPATRDLYEVGGPRPSERAHAFLIAIAHQESRCEHRFQVVPSSSMAAGPARGFWQFERAGGVAGVLSHPSTKVAAAALLDRYHVANNSYAVWRAIEGHDPLAAGLARLLIYSDPNPLPVHEMEAWSYYLRVWRPGKPHIKTWDEAWSIGNRIAKEAWS